MDLSNIAAETVSTGSIAGFNTPDSLIAPLVLGSPDLLSGLGIKKRVSYQ
jgi:hypothetical protein